MKRGALFLNARAGSLRPLLAVELRRHAEAEGLEVIEVGAGVDVAALVEAQLKMGRKAFVVAGGDGTLHYVMQALVGTDAVIGVVPLGTFNHFARDVGIPEEWREALDVALHGSVCQIDAGSVNGRFFINNLMLGIYPTIVKYRERFRDGGRKWRAYFYAVRLALRSFPNVSLAIESDHRFESVRTQLFVVSANPYDLSTSGLLAAKTAVDSGRLAVYWLPVMDRRRFVVTIARYLRGKVTATEGFRQMSTRGLKVHSAAKKVMVAVDGELVELPTPLTVAIVPAALLVRLPPDSEAARLAGVASRNG